MASQQIDAHAYALCPQPRIALRFNGQPRDFFGAESAWMHEQRSVLWSRHHGEREQQRQRRAQRHNKWKQLGGGIIPRKHETLDTLA